MIVHVHLYTRVHVPVGHGYFGLPLVEAATDEDFVATTVPPEHDGNGLTKSCIVSRSVGQWVSQSVSRSVSGSVSQSVGQSVSQSVGQSVSQSVGQSVSRSVGQWVSQSVSRSVSGSVGRSVSQSVSQRVSGRGKISQLCFCMTERRDACTCVCVCVCLCVCVCGEGGDRSQCRGFSRSSCRPERRVSFSRPLFIASALDRWSRKLLPVAANKEREGEGEGEGE